MKRITTILITALVCVRCAAQLFPTPAMKTMIATGVVPGGALAPGSVGTNALAPNIRTNMVDTSKAWDASRATYLSGPKTNWPAAPLFPGAVDFVVSNGFPFMRLSTNGTGGVSASWTGTNRFGW